jgi:hypothetical protein
VSDGAAFVLETGPAGISSPRSVSVVVTNRGTAAQGFDGEWLEGAGWALGSAAPTRLEPEQSAAFTLVFDPALVFDPLAPPETTTWPATLQVPGTEVQITVTAEVPPALRTVIIGDGGWFAWSDNYGQSFWQSGVPEAVDTRARAIAWGDGRWLRADANSMEWAATGTYAWSDDGETWQESTYSDDFWVTDCAWGVDRFACARGGVFTWSTAGGTVVHEPTDYSNLVNSLAYGDGVFVGVGRDGRRLVSSDATTWTVAVPFPDGDELRAVAYGDGRFVAVGGLNRFVASVSTDGGQTWTDTTWGPSQYAGLQTLAYHEGLWLAEGLSNEDPQMWRSTDGVTWEPLDHRSRYAQLGAVNGWFFAWLTDGVYRSRDGVTWDAVYYPPDGVTVRALAAESR